MYNSILILFYKAFIPKGACLRFPSLAISITTLSGTFPGTLPEAVLRMWPGKVKVRPWVRTEADPFMLSYYLVSGFLQHLALKGFFQMLTSMYLCIFINAYILYTHTYLQVLQMTSSRYWKTTMNNFWQPVRLEQIIPIVVANLKSYYFLFVTHQDAEASNMKHN